MEIDIKVGDIFYRAYYFGDEVIVDASKIASIHWEAGDYAYENTFCRMERTDDKSIHEIKLKRIENEFSTSRIKALTKLFDKHMKVINKVLAKMEGEESGG